MNNPQKAITKTCSNCGEQKPLSAFLELSGTTGSNYGNICSSCRKTAIENANRHPETDEVTTSSTGAKIDSKTKVQTEVDKREWLKLLKEQELEEREKKEKLTQKFTEKTQTIAKDEKKHRESYIEKRSFLDNKKKPALQSHTVFGGEEQKAAAGKLDFATGPVEVTRVAGLIKTTQSPVFQAFKNWLGNAAPIVSAAERAASQKKQAPADKKGTNPLTDLAEKTLGPKTRK